MRQRTVLISGAGVAGPTLTYWLARAGFRPTVVERGAGPRSSGNPVDVRGPAVEVIRRMGLTARLRDAATRVPGLVFVTGSGRRIGPVTLGRPKGDEVEVPRADLAAILHGAVRDDAEFVFGDSVVALHQNAGGVDVSFRHGRARRFDLVVGADGSHSTVRALAFGPETRYARHLGLYVATVRLHRPATEQDAVVMYNTPGRSVSVHPVRGDAVAAFVFRGPALPDLDADRRERVVLHAYRDGGWELPDLLDRLRAADDLYFDSVSRVRLPAWSTGRVALLGDAASCLTLFGDGSSMAITGAATLADALATVDDPTVALRAYETRHRPLVQARQRGQLFARALLVPATRPGLAARDLAVGLLAGTVPGRRGVACTVGGSG